jgi:hypothetical protein
MEAQVLRLRDFRGNDGYHYPLPVWVIEKFLLALRKAPSGLNALLANELGSADFLIGHCAALARIYGLLTDDFRDLFAAIAARFGCVAWSDAMAQTIGEAIECPGLRKQANETRRCWENPGRLNSAVLNAYEDFSRALMARHTDAWHPRNAVLKHAVLLIEAVRRSCVANGTRSEACNGPA